MEFTLETFGQFVRKERKSRKIRVEDMEKACGYSAGWIRAIERGQYLPSLLSAEAILNTLGYQLKLVAEEQPEGAYTHGKDDIDRFE